MPCHEGYAPRALFRANRAYLIDFGAIFEHPHQKGEEDEIEDVISKTTEPARHQSIC